MTQKQTSKCKHASWFTQELLIFRIKIKNLSFAHYKSLQIMIL